MTTDGSGNYDVIPNIGEGFLKRDGNGNFSYTGVSLSDLSDMDKSSVENAENGDVLGWDGNEWVAVPRSQRSILGTSIACRAILGTSLCVLSSLSACLP